MKIVLDFRKYDGVIGGVERGVIEITNFITQAGHTIIMLPKLSRLKEVEGMFRDLPNMKFIPLPVQTHVMSVKNGYHDSVTIQNIARDEDADVIHFPYNWSFPFRKKVPTVLTIHDVIPLTFREAMGLFTNRFLYRPGMRMATRLNSVIATVSEFSKSDIAEKLGAPAEKITVIPNGLRPPFEMSEELETELKTRYGIEQSFILYVGGIHERKNVAGLIRAFARLVHQMGYKGKLLVTGSVSGAPYQLKMKNQIDAVVEETGMGDRVVFTGFISDEELDSLLRCTQFLIYPSFYEGFGIPVLEAMRMGTPVITSNLTAMPEVAGEAALLVDPDNEENISATMSRLLGDEGLRKELVKKGRERAIEFSWERTANQYLDLYMSLAS
jgi:glycosyltransferase involved in cell wall biosynthesis